MVHYLVPPPARYPCTELPAVTTDDERVRKKSLTNKSIRAAMFYDIIFQKREAKKKTLQYSSTKPTVATGPGSREGISVRATQSDKRRSPSPPQFPDPDHPSTINVDDLSKIIKIIVETIIWKRIKMHSPVPFIIFIALIVKKAPWPGLKTRRGQKRNRKLVAISWWTRPVVQSHPHSRGTKRTRFTIEVCVPITQIIQNFTFSSSLFCFYELFFYPLDCQWWKSRHGPKVTQKGSAVNIEQHWPCLLLLPTWHSALWPRGGIAATVFHHPWTRMTFLVRVAMTPGELVSCGVFCECPKRKKVALMGAKRLMVSTFFGGEDLKYEK